VASPARLLLENFLAFEPRKSRSSPKQECRVGPATRAILIFRCSSWLICGFPVGALRPPNMALLHTVGSNQTLIGMKPPQATTQGKGS